uniref:RRM domain-containing protein n=1 Tax=Alexandrium andersonii TaxID=327968 RepID=A0A7S2GMB4_9DINO
MSDVMGLEPKSFAVDRAAGVWPPMFGGRMMHPNPTFVDAGLTECECAGLKDPSNIIPTVLSHPPALQYVRDVLLHGAPCGGTAPEDMTSDEDLRKSLGYFEDHEAIFNTLASHYEGIGERLARDMEQTKKEERRAQSVCEVPIEKRTTLMLRNLPNDYTVDHLLDLLNEKGFEAKFNFVYLPIDFKRNSGLGYAFVNMETHEDACRAMEKLNGLSEWVFNSKKVMSVHWGMDQGLQAHLDRYKNSPVMHPEMPRECRPRYFKDGVEMPFPAPTKKIRAPRAKARGAAVGEAGPLPFPCVDVP